MGTEAAGASGDSSQPFEPGEIEQLRALRRAASDIHRSSVMQGDQKLNVSLQVTAGAGAKISHTGPEAERFNSFMIALRRTYLNNDGANFRRVAKLLAWKAPQVRDTATGLRESYNNMLSGREVNLNGHAHEEVFEAWLHGYVFHDDDAKLRERWAALSQGPFLQPMALMLVQSIAIHLADHVLALDGLIAEVLREEPLSPISKESAAANPPLPRMSGSACAGMATVAPERSTSSTSAEVKPGT